MTVIRHMSLTVFACSSKVCAPPPVGTGGSRSAATKNSGSGARTKQSLSRVKLPEYGVDEILEDIEIIDDRFHPRVKAAYTKGVKETVAKQKAAKVNHKSDMAKWEAHRSGLRKAIQAAEKDEPEEPLDAVILWQLLHEKR